MGAPGRVASDLETEAALEESDGDNDHERNRWAYDPAEYTFDAREHRSSGPITRTVSLRNTTGRRGIAMQKSTGRVRVRNQMCNSEVECRVRGPGGTSLGRCFPLESSDYCARLPNGAAWAGCLFPCGGFANGVRSWAPQSPPESDSLIPENRRSTRAGKANLPQAPRFERGLRRRDPR